MHLLFIKNNKTFKEVQYAVCFVFAIKVVCWAIHV